jgi:hypothetical protein
MGRSRGGSTSKVHAVVDANGLPVRLGLTAGELEGYAFTAVIFFVCCFGMSSYSRRLERRLNRHS